MIKNWWKPYPRETRHAWSAARHKRILGVAHSLRFSGSPSVFWWEILDQARPDHQSGAGSTKPWTNSVSTTSVALQYSCLLSQNSLTLATLVRERRPVQTCPTLWPLRRAWGEIPLTSFGQPLDRKKNLASSFTDKFILSRTLRRCFHHHSCSCLQ